MERAARGDEGDLYPWGNEWVPGFSNSKENSMGDTTPVDYYSESFSPHGVMDMVGNVWEWTGDQYKIYPYKGPYPFEDFETFITIRGGDWCNDLKDTGASIRMMLLPEECGSSVGFRCASSIIKIKNRVDDL